MKKYRKKGVGKCAAEMIFDRFLGGWDISTWENNAPARLFWKKVVEDYTGGKYSKFSSAEREVVGFTFYNI